MNPRPNGPPQSVYRLSRCGLSQPPSGIPTRKMEAQPDFDFPVRLRLRTGEAQSSPAGRRVSPTSPGRSFWLLTQRERELFRQRRFRLLSWQLNFLLVYGVGAPPAAEGMNCRQSKPVHPLNRKHLHGEVTSSAVECQAIFICAASC